MSSGKDENKIDETIGSLIQSKEISKDIRTLLGRLFGPAVTEFGETLGDYARYIRLKHLAQILKKVQANQDVRDLPPEAIKALPFGDALRTIEAASYEEDETVQDFWARLIANATSPDGDGTIKKVYIEILKSLSAPEAALLDFLWTCEKRNLFKSREEVETFNEEMNVLAEQRWRIFPQEVRQIATQNLARIRCITFRPRPLHVQDLFANLPREMTGWPNGWAVVNVSEFQKLLEQLGDIIFAAAAVKDYESQASIPLQRQNPWAVGYHGVAITVPEMNFMLTALGTDLMRACEPPLERDNGKSA